MFCFFKNNFKLLKCTPKMRPNIMPDIYVAVYRKLSQLDCQQKKQCRLKNKWTTNGNVKRISSSSLCFMLKDMQL